MRGDGRERLAALLDDTGEACNTLGSPLYAGLLARASDDVQAGGVLAEVLSGHEDDTRGSALALRLLGAVHRLVLAGAAPDLAQYYPSVGGVADVASAWPAFRSTVEAQRTEIRARLDQLPQTNEVGRAAALVGGLLHAAARARMPVRLFEIGASAGLNLLADRFRYGHGHGLFWGPATSPVVLPDAWRGDLPPLDAPLSVVERHGADLAPVDPTTEEGRLRLQSYVWADQTERLARLRGALDLAEQFGRDGGGVRPERAGAGDFVPRIRLAEGTLTVLWHSIMWQYLAPPERAEVGNGIDRLGAEATADRPFAHVTLEPRRAMDAIWYPVVLRTWPGGESVVIGEAPPHGLPVSWRPAALPRVRL